MFLKHFHMDELEARIWEIAMAARRIQRVWKMYNTRRQTNLLCAAVDATSTQTSSRVRAQRAEDVERKNDLMRQIEDARVFAAERRRAEREAAAEAERQRIAEERARLRAAFQSSQEELLRLIQALRDKLERKEDIREGLTLLYQKLSDREMLVEDQFAPCRDKIARLRINIGRLSKEQEDVEMQREQLVAKMAYVLARAYARTHTHTHTHTHTRHIQASSKTTCQSLRLYPLGRTCAAHVTCALTVYTHMQFDAQVPGGAWGCQRTQCDQSNAGAA
jgi:chromosome segregation ATPase